MSQAGDVRGLDRSWSVWQGGEDGGWWEVVEGVEREEKE